MVSTIFCVSEKCDYAFDFQHLPILYPQIVLKWIYYLIFDYTCYFAYDCGLFIEISACTLTILGIFNWQFAKKDNEKISFLLKYLTT